MTDAHEAMRSMAETAVFSQWLHNAAYVDSLYYSRWASGEADLVSLDPAGQRPRFAVEVKWSDRVFDEPKESRGGVLEFSRKHKLKRVPLVTTISKHGERQIGGVRVEFAPVSLHCYTVGKNTRKRRR